jgi:hypothetical protein
MSLVLRRWVAPPADRGVGARRRHPRERQRSRRCTVSSMSQFSVGSQLSYKGTYGITIQNIAGTSNPGQITVSRVWNQPGVEHRAREGDGQDLKREEVQLTPAGVVIKRRSRIWERTLPTSTRYPFK